MEKLLFIFCVYEINVKKSKGEVLESDRGALKTINDF